MYSRNKRPTYDVLIDNLPLSVNDVELNKIFIGYGEVQNIHIRKVRGSKQVRVKFFCEPDADLVIKKYNGFVMRDKTVKARKVVPEQKESGSACGNSKVVPGPFSKKHGKYMQRGMGLSAAEQSLKSMDYAIMDCKQSTSSAASMKHPSSPADLEITCTYVENATTFYGHRTSEKRIISELASALQQHCAFIPRLKKTPTYKKLYGAVYSGDNMWYRCRIMNNRKQGKAFVQYIDYGNSEELVYSMMVELPEFLKKYPCMATKCTISCVSMEPVMQDRILSLKAIDFLQQSILGRTVIVTTFSPEKSPTLAITRCICNGVNIIQCLIDDGYVVPKPVKANNSPDGHFNALSESSDVKAEVSQFCVPSAASGKKSSASSVSSSSPVSTSVVVMKERDTLKAKVVELEQKLKAVEKDLAQRKGMKFDVVEKLEHVASQIQVVNQVRKKPQNWNYLTQFLDLLRSVANSKQPERSELLGKIKESTAAYKNTFKSIFACQEKSELEDLISKKNCAKEQLCNSINEYINLPLCVDGTTIDVLKTAADNLISHLNTSHDLVLEKEPSSLDELFDTCRSLLVPETAAEVREQTNAAHARFLREFSQIRKAFCLHGSEFSEEASDNCNELQNESSASLFPQSLMDSLQSLEEALSQEASVLSPASSPKHHTSPTVVECLLKEINSAVEEFSNIQCDVEKYSVLMQHLSTSHSVEEMISDLTRIRKDIKSMKSKLRHMLVDKKDLEETDVRDQAAISEVDEAISSLLRKLHDAFVLEDYNMKNLTKLYESVYPELNLQYPELGIAQYAETKGVLKQGWEADHFNCEKLTDRLDACFKALFCGEPVVLKEFLLDSEEKLKELMLRVLKWNTLYAVVMPVSALFRKGERQVYVMTTYMDAVGQLSDLSFEKRVSIVSNVLDCIESLHSIDLVHGVIHPSTVLLDDETVKLDFCSDTKQFINKLRLNGIHYLPPELVRGSELSRASDMYMFGCFALSMLFPDVQFNTFPEGTPNLSLHKSTVEKVLPPSDYSILASLVSSNLSLRPTTVSLKKMDFLKNVKSPPPESVFSKYVSMIDSSESVESKHQDISRSDSSDELQASGEESCDTSNDEDVSDLDLSRVSVAENLAEVSNVVQNLQQIDGSHCDEEKEEDQQQISSPMEPREDGTLKRLFALRESIKCPVANAPVMTSVTEPDQHDEQNSEVTGEENLDSSVLIPAPVDPDSSVSIPAPVDPDLVVTDL